MSWFAWLLIVYFWLNLLHGIKIMGKQYVFTRSEIAWYACVTAFMTWAAITQIG